MLCTMKIFAFAATCLLSTEVSALSLSKNVAHPSKPSSFVQAAPQAGFRKKTFNQAFKQASNHRALALHNNHGRRSAVGQAPFPFPRGDYAPWKSGVTLGFWLIMVILNAIYAGNIKDVNDAYDTIERPYGIGFSIWGIIFAFEFVGIALGFAFPGGNASGAGGKVNDIASFNNKMEWFIRALFLLQGVWTAVFTQSKIDNPAYRRGEGGNAAFWAAQVLIFVIAGINLFIQSEAWAGIQNAGWDLPGRWLLGATAGLSLNAGWVLGAVAFSSNMIAYAYDQQKTGVSTGLQVAATITVMLQVAIGALPFLIPFVRARYAFFPAYLALSWAFAWNAYNLFASDGHGQEMKPLYGFQFVTFWKVISVFLSALFGVLGLSLAVFIPSF